MVRGTQQARATIRVTPGFYQELVAIAEARDVTLQQAFDFYLERERKKAAEQAEPKVKVQTKEVPQKVSKKGLRDALAKQFGHEWTDKKDLGKIYSAVQDAGVQLT